MQYGGVPHHAQIGPEKPLAAFWATIWRGKVVCIMPSPLRVSQWRQARAPGGRRPVPESPSFPSTHSVGP